MARESLRKKRWRTSVLVWLTVMAKTLWLREETQRFVVVDLAAGG